MRCAPSLASISRWWYRSWLYLNGLLHGNLGISWQTTRPVFEDLLLRFPATLELITFGLLGALAIGIPLGIGSAYRRTSLLGRIGDFYGLAAGALPNLWLALVLIYVFYTRWAGRRRRWAGSTSSRCRRRRSPAFTPSTA